MTRGALDRGEITEVSVINALLSTRGDIFLTSQYLGCTAREVDSYLRASEGMMAFYLAIDKVKKDEGYEKMSVDQFEDRLDTLTRAYKVDAIDVIHGLAMMPFENAAMADVKLKAAIELRGSSVQKAANNGDSAILSELNALYQTSAPRIKTIRIAQIEFESTPPLYEVVQDS